MTYRLPGIAKVEADIKAAREQAREQVRAMQAACPHHQIVANAQWGGGRRICAACGIEEASAYNWPGITTDGGYYEFLRPPKQKTILNSEFVKIGDVLKHRLTI